MPLSSQSNRPARAFSLADLFWIIFIVALLITILLPSLSRSRQQAKYAVCSSNLRGIGLAVHIYANDFREWMPMHYFAPPTGPGDKYVVNVNWVGTMGSNDFLRISQPTTPEISADKNHPSRSQFLLVMGGMLTTGAFVCPSGPDRLDDLRNYGPDADEGNTESTARIGKSRFDFAGYDRLSYGYQLPYGRRGRPRENLDSRMPIFADKGPYYADGGSGMAGTRTKRDRRSEVNPPAEWSNRAPMEIAKMPAESWREYNSRNHGGEGQNVLYVDGHVDYQRTPLAGVHRDNLYTIQSGFANLSDGMIGRVPHADQPLGPLTNSDSFLVP